jgi:predicted house-cleaning noncanonical NTP pyrophosphatase (MazG superfamily)
MAEFVSGALKEMGPAGAAIWVLMGTITIMAGAVVALWRQNNAATKARLAERDIFAKIVESNTTALTKNADATSQRNLVTEELSDAIKSQATSATMVNERVSLYHGDNKEKLKDVIEVVSSMAEAVRVNTGMVTEVRNGNITILNKLERRSRS